MHMCRRRHGPSSLDPVGLTQVCEPPPAEQKEVTAAGQQEGARDVTTGSAARKGCTRRDVMSS